MNKLDMKFVACEWIAAYRTYFGLISKMHTCLIDKRQRLSMIPLLLNNRVLDLKCLLVGIFNWIPKIQGPFGVIALSCVVNVNICYVFLLTQNSDLEVGVHIFVRQVGVPFYFCVVAPDIWGPQCWTRFVSLLQFWVAAGFLGKFVHPCFKVQKLIRNKEFSHFISYAKRTLTELAAGRLQGILIFWPCRSNITCISLEL
jgi:hypothetical protein